MGEEGGVLPFWEMLLNLIKNIPCFFANATSWLQNSRPPQEVCDCVSPSHITKGLNRDHTLAFDREEGGEGHSPSRKEGRHRSGGDGYANASGLRKNRNRRGNQRGDGEMTVAVVRRPEATQRDRGWVSLR